MAEFDFPGLDRGVSLQSRTTLQAGGRAEMFFEARTLDDLRQAAIALQNEGVSTLVLGGGSNILPSDDGVRGCVLQNSAAEMSIMSDGTVIAETGCLFQDLFLKTAQAGLSGFEFAVGIPGSLGGALVSNAGAYRSGISKPLVEIEIVRDGRAEWVDPAVLELSYRDSILRRPNPPAMVITQARFELKPRESLDIYNDARSFQRQRIGKQPPQASAGSFFKNVNSKEFANRLHDLPDALRKAGVVPAGFLIERTGLQGLTYHGAQVGIKHANFMLNKGGAKAADIRRLGEHVKAQVNDAFGATLEEEVLYVGDWIGWKETGQLP